MKEIRKEDIKQEVFDLYDDYAHNRLERRDFLQKLSAYAVGGITVTCANEFSDARLFRRAIQVNAG